MIVKNISDKRRYFTFGPRVRGFHLDAGGQRFVPDSEVALNFSLQHQAEGVLAIIGGPSVTTVLTPAATPASLPVQIKATPEIGDFVTIDGVKFTFATTGSGATGVTIGDSKAAAAANLSAKINDYDVLPTLEVRAEVVTIAGEPCVVLISKKPGAIGNEAHDVVIDGVVDDIGDRVDFVGSQEEFLGGTNSGTAKFVSYSATLPDTPLPIRLTTGLKAIKSLIVQARDQALEVKVFHSLIAVTGGTIQITAKTPAGGVVNLAQNDVLEIIAIGE